MDKKIPTKNYIILIVIVIITVIAVLYVRSQYIALREYNSQHSPILTVVNEINSNEISNYTLENPKFILYASSGQNWEIKKFEKAFRNYVINKNLSDSMLYINVDNIDKEELANQLRGYANSQISGKISVDENATLYIFENGKITHVIIKANNLTTEQIDILLKKYGMLDNA